MEQKNNFRTKKYYDDCKASKSLDDVLSNMRTRRDRILRMIYYIQTELDELKTTESFLSARIAEIEKDIKKENRYGKPNRKN